MSEEWKENFFEWRDEIESKFNKLSQKALELEKKFEDMPSLFKINNEIQEFRNLEQERWSWTEEQIAELKEHKHPEIIGKKDVYNLDFIGEEIKKVLRDLHELMRDLVSDLQDSNSLSKSTIKCYEGKLIKNLEKLDSKKEYKYFDFDTKEYSWGKYYDLGIIESKKGNLHDYTPSQFVKDYAKTHTLFSLHGVMFSEPKEKATEPENIEEEWECPICKKTVFVGYTVHRHCFDSFSKELIEGFIKKLAKLPAQNIVDEHGDNNVVIDGCWISKLSEEYEAMLN